MSARRVESYIAQMIIYEGPAEAITLIYPIKMSDYFRWPL